MPAPKPDTPLPKSDAVESFLAGLVHPLAKEVGLLRTVILSSDPRLREGIKWNAPSFFYGDWFATFHLRSDEEVVVILHRGAKAKATPKSRLVDDADSLVTWITNDRGKMVFRSAKDITARRVAIQRLIRNWLAAMDRDAN